MITHIHNTEKTSIKCSRTLICCAERRIFASFPKLLAGSGMNYRSPSLLAGLDPYTITSIKAAAPLISDSLSDLEQVGVLRCSAYHHERTAIQNMNRSVRINESDPKRRLCHMVSVLMSITKTRHFDRTFGSN